ncbi:unnamed protein product [Prorocentrum cordatum]|uniref:Myb/SANT-like domain-containing protein n=1 Tax=Prorocentrum cordatum TaxID=2364126 RepID=A0ABN9Q6Z1_9DINO|nr:unnamed protein product [Polarella glacialis]
MARDAGGRDPGPDSRPSARRQARSGEARVGESARSEILALKMSRVEIETTGQSGKVDAGEFAPTIVTAERVDIFGTGPAPRAGPAVSDDGDLSGLSVCNSARREHFEAEVVSKWKGPKDESSESFPRLLRPSLRQMKEDEGERLLPVAHNFRRLLGLASRSPAEAEGPSASPTQASAVCAALAPQSASLEGASARQMSGAPAAMAGAARTCDVIESFGKVLNAAIFDASSGFLAAVKRADVEECDADFATNGKSGTSDRAGRWAQRGPRRARASCCDARGDFDIPMAKGTEMAGLRETTEAEGKEGVTKSTSKKKQAKFIAQVDEVFLDKLKSQMATTFDTLGLRKGMVAAADGWRATTAATNHTKDRDGWSGRDLQHAIAAHSMEEVKKQCGFTTNRIENHWSVLKMWLKKSRGGRLSTTSERRTWARWVTEFQDRKAATTPHSMDDSDAFSLPTKNFLSNVRGVTLAGGL